MLLSPQLWLELVPLRWSSFLSLTAGCEVHWMILLWFLGVLMSEVLGEYLGVLLLLVYGVRLHLNTLAAVGAAVGQMCVRT